MTCLATRAVHLELCHSLSTDSFLMAFRRFISRRGRPKEVFSDNGTNLRSGERERERCVGRSEHGTSAPSMTASRKMTLSGILTRQVRATWEASESD